MSMRHPEAALIPYLRGELSAEEHAEVARHLQGCTRCRKAADSSLAAMQELARRIEALPIPGPLSYRAELRRKLGARLEAGAGRGAERYWLRPRMASLSLGALGAAAAASILLLLMRGARVAPPPMEQLATPDAAMQEAAMAGADVGLLRDYPVVERLDLFENYDVIAHLDELSPSAEPNDERRS
jgi:anti-sigma factor RsiW